MPDAEKTAADEKNGITTTTPIANSSSSSPNSLITTFRSTFLTSNRQKWLSILAIVFLVVLALLILTGLLIFFLTHPEELCTTPGCLAAGSELSSSLNTSVDPCENFYAFACGGWVESHPIPDDETSQTTYSLANNRAQAAMRTIFDQSLSSAEVSPSSKAKSVQLVLDLYRECMDMEARDRVGLEPVRKLVHRVLGTGWPVLREDQLPADDRLEAIQGGKLLTTLALMAELGVGHLAYVYPGTDAKNTQSKIINFLAPGFSLPRKEFENANGTFTAEVDLYRRMIQEFGHLFFFASNPNRTIRLGQSEEKELTSRIDEVFTFERTLSLATRPAGEDRNATVWYNKMTLEEFTSKTGGNFLNYTVYLNELATLFKLPYRFHRTDKVVVRDVGYYEKLSRILLKTPPLTLHNFLGKKLAYGWVGATDSHMREFAFRHASLKTGVRQMTPLWKDCLGTVGGWAASRLYVDHFVLPGTKEKATEVVNDLKEVFSEVVLKRDVDWLDEPTRKRALEKAAKTHYYVAYPDWLLNDTALDAEVYHFTDKDYVQVERGQYFSAVVEATRRAIGVHFAELHRKPDVKRDFLAPPSAVNAFAAHAKNAIAITAGELQPPFFDPTVPAYLNYGGVGAVIGHEITHHFDDKGAQYDLNGNLVNWWSGTTRQRFSTGAKCFVAQYEAFVDPITGVRLNGTRTLGENISDNGGLRMATLAMEASLRKKKESKKSGTQKLPGLEQFTAQQAFFLSYAHMWCGHYRVKARKVRIDHYAHLPGEYRINVPLSNLEQFSAAFSCPLGSRMNPRKKCRLW